MFHPRVATKRTSPDGLPRVRAINLARLCGIVEVIAVLSLMQREFAVLGST